MKLRSTRQAIHDALSWGQMHSTGSGFAEYLLYLTKIEKSIKNNDPCVDVVEVGYICAAINTLPPHIGGWLKFAYGESSSDLLQTILAAKLRFDLFPISSPKKHGQLLALASVSLEDYRLRLWRNRDLPEAVYCERMEIFQANFNRDGWDDKKDACLDAIRPWDSEGVGQISRMVKALRGDDESEQPMSPTEVLKELANDKWICV
jgi:hypothetical protein